jgi:DNA-binding CsgD family transcriptional regulator
VTLLSAIELDVLQGAAAGESYAQTARRIFITEKSVSNVATRIMRKLGAQTMPNAVFIACQLRILEPNRRHGDHPGFVTHKRRGEEPCEACWAGEREYRAELRRKRRQKPADGRESVPQPARGVRDARDAASGSPGRSGAAA